MTLRATLGRVFQHEDINFLVTNRIPRRLATRFMGWLSQITNPIVRDASIWVWRQFSVLDLSEAKTTHFRSLHDCFIRELRDGARPVDPNPTILTSPCDAIVGACGKVEGLRVFQIKGFPYRLEDLLGSHVAAEPYQNGLFVTLRLTAGMYHRFHAPCDAVVERVTYISGDTWNVNPIALKRVEALFCRNERAALRLRLEGTSDTIELVAVAAILVASVRLRFLDVALNLRRGGARTIPCSASLVKGEEMGWFQHGSTIVLLAPAGYELHASVSDGFVIKVGQPLLVQVATSRNGKSAF